MNINAVISKLKNILFMVMLISCVYAESNVPEAKLKIKELEKSFDGRIGVYALNTANNAVIAYRPNERFPMAVLLNLWLVQQYYIMLIQILVY